MSKFILNTYPELQTLLEKDPTWLDCAVNAEEAAKITGISVDALARYRSRSGGPRFLRPTIEGQELRIVRYFRRDLYEWLLSGGRRDNTFDCR
jgi:hypothetical protein